MTPPPELRTEEYRDWSRGRGVDVWAMPRAAREGELERLRELTGANPRLADREYARRHPLRFAVAWTRFRPFLDPASQNASLIRLGGWKR